METIELKNAISRIISELKNDKGYYESWQANIAMSYKDNDVWYKNKTGKKYLNKNDKHIIANNAAVYFLNQLCNNNETSEQIITDHKKDFIDSFQVWKTIVTDIDFKKHEPISTGSSLHIYEEQYLIDGNTYRLLYGEYSDIPLIDILIK